MHCSCMAGLGEAYTHVAVFSFSLKYILKFAQERRHSNLFRTKRTDQ